MSPLSSPNHTQVDLTMTELEHIIDQVRRSFQGDAWHGPSVREALAGVDARMAATPGIAGGHSIAVLATHLLATMDILLGRMAGEIGLVDDDAYWPQVVPLDETTWRGLLLELDQQHQQVVEALAAFPAERLDAPLFAGGSPAFNNFLGHAQHNAYHAGQIALLKRAQSAR